MEVSKQKVIRELFETELPLNSIPNLLRVQYGLWSHVKLLEKRIKAIKNNENLDPIYNTIILSLLKEQCILMRKTIKQIHKDIDLDDEMWMITENEMPSDDY